MSLAEVARLSGVSTPTISKIMKRRSVKGERGQFNPVNNALLTFSSPNVSHQARPCGCRLDGLVGFFDTLTTFNPQ